MNRHRISFLFFFLALSFVKGQSPAVFADSIRKAHAIPELGYAVISSDAVLALNVCGEKRINTSIKAELKDKFRIGSNTKAISGFIAALLVKEKKISWNTEFFALFPELKKKSNPVYHRLTLLNLLSFRTKLFPYTYTYAKPVKGQFKGNEEEQRYQFAKWFFQQEPVKNTDSVCFSNLGYIAAGLMLEKASGKSYKELVRELGKQLDIEFGFGNPNYSDSLQPWGHDNNLVPEPPAANYKLDWLLAAGNIHVSLPGYAKFIQLQLKGLEGKSEMLSKEEFLFLHFGLNKFAVGWFWEKTGDGTLLSYNTGNPGTFLTRVCVYPNSDRAYILFANAQTPGTEAGFKVLLEELKRKYEK